MTKPIFDLFQITEFTGLYIAGPTLFTTSFEVDVPANETTREIGDKITYFHNCEHFPHYGKKYAINFDIVQLKEVVTKMTHWADMGNREIRLSCAVFFGMTFAMILENRQHEGSLYIQKDDKIQGKQRFTFCPNDQQNHKHINITLDNKLLDVMMDRIKTMIETASRPAQVYAIRSGLRQITNNTPN